MNSKTANSRFSGCSRICLLVLAVLSCTQLGSAGAKETVLYSFCNECGDSPDYPGGSVIIDSSGNFYFSSVQTPGGGLFELSPPATAGESWTFNLLQGWAVAPGSPIVDASGGFFYVLNDHSWAVAETSPPAHSGGYWTTTEFGGALSGSPGRGEDPNVQLVFRNGHLYGTTASGGDLETCGGAGCGIVFDLVQQSDKTWKENELHRFVGGTNDGESPVGDIVFSEGGIYGTTLSGGTNGFGVFYKLAIVNGAWTETVLYNFTADTGPAAGLVADSSGNFFGPANGPNRSDGLILELSPPATTGTEWQENTLYTFTGKADGAHPNAPLRRDGLGNLYGTTSGGAGSWAELGVASLLS
jgi:hypothetical protein